MLRLRGRRRCSINGLILRIEDCLGIDGSGQSEQLEANFPTAPTRQADFHHFVVVGIGSPSVESYAHLVTCAGPTEHMLRGILAACSGLRRLWNSTKFLCLTSAGASASLCRDCRASCGPLSEPSPWGWRRWPRRRWRIFPTPLTIRGRWRLASTRSSPIRTAPSPAWISKAKPGSM